MYQEKPLNPSNVTKQNKSSGSAAAAACRYLKKNHRRTKTDQQYIPDHLHAKHRPSKIHLRPSSRDNETALLKFERTKNEQLQKHFDEKHITLSKERSMQSLFYRKDAKDMLDESENIPLSEHTAAGDLISSKDFIFNNHNTTQLNISGKLFDSNSNALGFLEKKKVIIFAYWDIANCSVSHGTSTLDIVKKIRNTYLKDCFEAEFIIACDIRSLNQEILNELPKAQVTLIHVDFSNDGLKLKMQQQLKYAMFKGYKSVIIFIGPAKFENYLIDIKHKYCTYIVLMHIDELRTGLQFSVLDKTIPFNKFIIDLPSHQINETQFRTIVIGNLPLTCTKKELRKALNFFLKKVNGLIIEIEGSLAKIQFSNSNDAICGAKYLQQQHIFGNSISVLPSGETSSKLQAKFNRKENTSSSKQSLKKNCTKESKLKGQKEAYLLISVSDKAHDISFWKSHLMQYWNSNNFEIIETKPEWNLIKVKFQSNNAAKKAKNCINARAKNIGIQNVKLLVTDEKCTSDDSVEANAQKEETENNNNYCQAVDNKIINYLKLHDQKIISIQEKLYALQDDNNACKSKNKNSEILALKHELDQFIEQKLVFMNFSDKVKDDLKQTALLSADEKESTAHKLMAKFSRECFCFTKALPIYAKKNSLINLVKRNQVSVLLAETGSGKSTQIVQYLWQAELSTHGVIICTQPRKMAAITVAEHVSGQIGSAFGSIVGYQVGTTSKKTDKTAILFMTDFALLKDCIQNPDFKNISCIIIDEAHERSIFTDLLLGIIKRILPYRPDLKVIITSATIDPSVFIKYFNLEDDAVMNISGRVFPIEDIWEQDTNNSSYLEKSVKCAYQIHLTEGLGDILIFLPTPAETEKAVLMFEKHMKDNFHNESKKPLLFSLHGKQDLQDQKKIFSPSPGTRKIIFATNCAETSVTIPGVVYVVDSGMVKEVQYNSEANTGSLVLNYVTQSSANQRRGRAGRTQPGKCYHLYSKETYTNMKKNMVPEILRVNISQAVLKLMSLGVHNILQFEFVESPPIEALTKSVQHLKFLGAINEDNILTSLGHKMAKLPLDPKLSKFVLKSVEEDIGYESVIIASGASLSGKLFYRNEDNKDEADAKKVRFCEEEGDFLTLLKVYIEWLSVPNSGKGKWCAVNCINGKSMNAINLCVKELTIVLSNELKLNFSRTLKDVQVFHRKFQLLLLECFSENLCVFSGHPKYGYISPLFSDPLFIHPSSALCYLGKLKPQFILYLTVLKTTSLYLLCITPISKEIIEECLQMGNIKIDLDSLMNLPFSTKCISPVSERILRGIIGKGGKNISALKDEIKQHIKDDFEIDINVKKGIIEIFVKTQFVSKLEEFIHCTIANFQAMLMTEEMDFPNSKSLAVVLGCGGLLNEIILPGDCRCLEIQFSTESFSFEDLKMKLEKLGEIQNIHSNNSNKIVVTFKKCTGAKNALKNFKKNDKMQIRSLGGIRKSEANSHPMFKIKASGLRRPCTGMAYVGFSPLDYSEACAYLTSRTVYFDRMRHLFIRPNKHNKDELFIKDLPPTATAADLTKTLKTYLPGTIEMKKIVISRKKPFPPDENEIRDIERSLESAISPIASCNINVNVQQIQPQYVNWLANISFQNAQEGQRVFNAIKHRTFLCQLHPIEFKVDLYSNIFCSEKIFNVVKKLIDSASSFLQDSKNKENTLSIKTSPCKKNKDNIMISISSNNLQDMEDACRAIKNILQGECIRCSGNSLLEKLFLPAGKKFLQDMEKDLSLYIHINYREKLISIFGAQTSYTKAQCRINSYLDSLDKEAWEKIFLSNKSRPKGLLKELIKQYGHDLEGFRQQNDLKAVEVLISKHMLIITGSEESRAKAQKCLNTISTELDGNINDNEDETCPVCFGSIDEQYQRLSYCGHAYCKECIVLQMKNISLPMKCCSEDCDKPFVVQDFKNLINKSDGLYNSIINEALNDYVGKNKDEVHFCITPDCPMVYRINKSVEEPFRCPECLNDICTKCHALFHHGMSCKMYQCSETDEDYALKVWLSKNPMGRKQCPSCHTAIEKNNGCNHMHCSKCSAHFCWLCSKVFSTDMRVYEHLPLCPLQPT